MKISLTPLEHNRVFSRALITILVLFAPHALTCRAQNSTTAPVVVQAPPTQAQPAAQQQQPADVARKTPRVTGSIKGRVIGDAGEPLPGIAVYALTRAFNPSAFNSSARAQHFATADDEGNFSIGGLEPGLYGLSAAMPGYVSESDMMTGRAADIYRPGDIATVRLVKGGVITGSVTDSLGQPLVASSVRVYRVRDLDGRASDAYSNFANEGRTDDRGVYRIYGLRPGIYVVAASGSAPAFLGPAAALGDVPTFFPSSTRDTAAEVTVRAGQDTAGVDIRFRDDQQGHRVTGRIEMPDAQPGENAVAVSLTYVASGIQAGNAYVMPNSTNHSFSLEAIPDGEYDVQASSAGRDGLASTSAPQRVSVRGADVTGLRLALAPLASAGGTLIIEPASEAERASAACKDHRASLLPQETLISAVAERPAKGSPFSRLSIFRDSAPDASGAFTLRNLEPGRYRLALRPADEMLYVRSVELPGSSNATASPSTPSASTRTTSALRPTTTTTGAQTQRASAATHDFFDIRAGQQLSGIRVRLAEGAAGLSGHIVAAENSTLPPLSSLRVYLLPAEREQADNTLRFYETTPAPDGSFSFKNLAPGRYLAAARTADPNETSPRQAFRDADSRAKLRRDAETANLMVEFQPCQRANDFTLRLPPTK